MPKASFTEQVLTYLPCNKFTVGAGALMVRPGGKICRENKACFEKEPNVADRGEDLIEQIGAECLRCAVLAQTLALRGATVGEIPKSSIAKL